MSNQNTEQQTSWPQKKTSGCAWIVLLFFLIIVLAIIIGGGEEGERSPAPVSQPSAKEEKQKFNCEEKIEHLGNIKPSKSGEKFKLIDIKTNTVEYLLNKKEVMVEYCITAANFTSDMINLELRVKFLDKGGNVLAEKEDYIFDIPGSRTKTEYGSEFVKTNIAQEIEKIYVSVVKRY
jgi:hypothetical protein